MTTPITTYIEKLEKALIDLSDIYSENNFQSLGSRFRDVFEKNLDIFELVDQIRNRRKVSPLKRFCEQRCLKCGKIVQHFPNAKSTTCGRCKNICKNHYYRDEDNELPKPHTKIRICFKEGGNQLPDLMIIKEEIINGMIDHAQVIYLEDKMTSEIIIEGSTHITEEKHIYPDLK